ncbi:MAG: hypothetical protein H6832_13210 [Planctomycetes bacterium]|nr:hypothetical protein [Planctomycetota bacterium]MCB9892638.1 hypothetical protein [Planctomycetota bacterium]MCB9919355.1 hypothetical protein [Planctomycetota bacterium]
MIRLALFVTLTTLLGSCTRENFGVSSPGSLGDAGRLEALFTEKGLSKTTKDVDLHEIDGSRGGEDIAMPGRCDTYTDDARAGDTQTAKIYFDDLGAFVAIKFHYRSDERDYDKGYYKISRVLHDYWNTVGGAGATFGLAGGAIPILGKEALVASFENGNVRGQWVKQVFDGNMRDRVEDTVIVRTR